jgi:1,4-dihydroxy-2-naphthoyl-CoA hydrolase
MSDFLDVIRQRGIGALDKKMGIEIIEASPNRLVGTMPVEGNTQPIGLLHGGANVVLAESLGSIGTQLHAGPTRKIVGVDINATHHKSATSGIVTGVATAITLGKTLCSYQVEITNEKGERTCTARITCLILADRSGSFRRSEALASLTILPVSKI